LESFDATGGIDQLLLTGEKGMTFRANLEMDLRFRRAGLESLTAGALDNRLNVIRMYVCLH
jgi:hypothetical protein